MSGLNKENESINALIDNKRSKDKIQDFINKIDAIIDELFSNALKSVSTSNYAEYELDTRNTQSKNDGTKTRIKYLSSKEISEQIESYEKLREFYMKQLLKS